MKQYKNNTSLKFNDMKKFFVIFGLILGVIFTSSSQTAIVAGQITGTNIHYTDYLPDSNIYLGQNNDGFMLDIDNNGTYDLLLNMGIQYGGPSPADIMTWSTIQILSNNVKICLNNNVSNWINNFTFGDTISENSIWSSTIDTLYYFQRYTNWTYPPPGGENSEGEFGYGYMGFQMNFPGETFYGWIYIEGGNFTLTAKEKAICGLTVGTSEIINSDNLLKAYPNPFSDRLTIESLFYNKSGMRIEIINLQGITVKSYYIENEKSQINTSLLTPGIYLIRIKEGDKTIFRTKALKI